MEFNPKVWKCKTCGREKLIFRKLTEKEVKEFKCKECLKGGK